MRIEDCPPGARYIRLYATPRMVRALLVHQRDQDSIESNFTNRINRFEGIPMSWDEYERWRDG